MNIRKTILLFSLSLVLFVGGLSFADSQKASAYYNGGKIIDNGIFLNANSMSASQIQNFLASKGSGLASRSFVLQCYGANSQERQLYTSVGAACDQNMSAANIIYYASRIYGINPQVIISTLQKEQSLITTGNPTSWQLNQAMGYGCPTTGNCSDNSTFSYQIDSGVWAMRFHYERANGNNNWWSPSSSWVCGTEKNFYKPNLYPGQNVSFYDGNNVLYRTYFIENAATSSLYCYTPHAYNNPQGLYGRPAFGTTGQYYTGSYNFVASFEEWFGSTSTPLAFKSAANSTVYLSVNGYKVAVPSMGMLQDYGIDPNSIQTLSQATVDGIQTPDLVTTGISPTLSYIVKSSSDSDEDGGALYLISIAKKNQIQSMEQFDDFGFNTQNISYLPLSFIKTLQDSGLLSNYISTPVSAAFQVSSGSKRIIFDYPTYVSLNPSNHATPVSYYISDLIPSGAPISTREVLVKYADSDTLYLFTNSTYYRVSTFDAYNCWGFESTLHTPIYRVAFNNYLAPFAPVSDLSCLVKNETGTNYLLSNTNKYSVPPSFEINNAQTTATNLLSISERLPTSGSPLTQYVRGRSSPIVWSLEGGIKKHVTTYSNYVLLKINASQLTYIDDYSLSTIPSSGIKLGSGQIVKATGSPSVYLISGNARILYSRSDDFLGYQNSWSSIESYPAAVLDQLYPYGGTSINRYLYDAISDRVYLADPNGCYRLDSSLLSDYGQSVSAIKTGQSYTSDLFVNLILNSCRDGSKYVKDPYASAVYLIEGGQKRQFSSWEALLRHNNQSNPQIINMSTSNLQSFNTGTNIN
ncbi:MAG: hypothetical protein WCK80_01705 [bacterium]